MRKIALAAVGTLVLSVMFASGSNPEWPATTKPAIKACSAIA